MSVRMKKNKKKISILALWRYFLIDFYHWSEFNRIFYIVCNDFSPKKFQSIVCLKSQVRIHSIWSIWRQFNSRIHFQYFNAFVCGTIQNTKFESTNSCWWMCSTNVYLCFICDIYCVLSIFHKQSDSHKSDAFDFHEHYHSSRF